MLQPGQRIGPYQLQLSLGRGASSEVWRASRADVATPAALKVFLPEGASGAALAEARRRFVQEAQTARRLTHPHIIAVLDAGEHQGLAWMAMEYVPGHDLGRYTARHRLLPEPLALGLAGRVAQALDHAHAQGVVHRDVKPANVRVDLPRDVVKLGDFGVARLDDATLTRTGLVLGTPEYMAPEQLAGGQVGPQADLYALGVLLFEMLTGRRPHRGASLGELMRAVATDPAPDLRSLRPELPAPLAELAASLLAGDPQARPASAAEVARTLAALAATWPAPAA
jgi:eukaryotic-like serine/threonine-protein kinase